MRKLTVEYASWWRTRKLEVDVPDRWEDLNARQFKVCADMIASGVDDATFVCRYYGLKKKIVDKLTKFELYKLTEIASFAVNPSGRTDSFYMKRIPGIFERLTAPAKRLAGVSFEHFALFDTFYFDYANDTNKKNLARFVATLYLMPGEKVTNVDMEKRIRYVERHVDESTQNAIFLNYFFIRKWLAQSFRFLFEEKEPAQDSGTKLKKVEQKNRPDWNAILEAVMGDDILKYEEYKSTPAILIFKTVNKRIKDYRKNAK